MPDDMVIEDQCDHCELRVVRHLRDGETVAESHDWPLCPGFIDDKKSVILVLMVRKQQRNVENKWPAYLKSKIEKVKCRRCSAELASCINPRSNPLCVTISFADGEREFCYERVYDYLESHRKPEN